MTRRPAITATTAALLGALLRVPATAAPPDLPAYDVDGRCATLWRDDFGRRLCIMREQGGYDYLRTVWPMVPLALRDACIASAVGPDRSESYEYVASCIGGRLGWAAIGGADRFRP